MNFDTELENIRFEDQDIDMEQLYCFVDRLEQEPNKRNAIPAIFKFFEAHFDKDLGSPGPLVHFLEEEDDYFTELQDSIARKPTEITVWMINRILNSEEQKNKKKWLSMLSAVVSHPHANKETIDSAQEFIDYQKEKI